MTAEEARKTTEDIIRMAEELEESLQFDDIMDKIKLAVGEGKYSITYSCKKIYDSTYAKLREFGYKIIPLEHFPRPYLIFWNECIEEIYKRYEKGNTTPPHRNIIDSIAAFFKT